MVPNDFHQRNQTEQTHIIGVVVVPPEMHTPMHTHTFRVWISHRALRPKRNSIRNPATTWLDAAYFRPFAFTTFSSSSIFFVRPGYRRSGGALSRPTRRVIGTIELNSALSTSSKRPLHDAAYSMTVCHGARAHSQGAISLHMTYTSAPTRNDHFESI